MPQSSQEQREQRRLLEFLFTMRVFAAAFGMFEVAAGLFFSHWPLLVVGAGTLILAGVSLIARHLARRGDVRLAAQVGGYGLLAIAAVAGPLAPYAAECLVLVAIAGVGAVLPYLRGRALLVFLAATLTAIMIVVVGASMADARIVIGGHVDDIIDVLAVGATASVVLLLLWQFSERLRITLDEARRAVRVRDEFLSIASHELRTPLTSLQLAVQGMQRAPPTEQGRSLAIVARQVTKLSRLVTEMLNVGRIQMGRLELELDEVDLSDVVRDVVDRFASDLENAGSRVALRLSPARGVWDRDKLEHVVMNLLSNAIKFGAGKPIEIVVESSEDGARLSVIDRGIGIAREQIPRLFEKFERAVSARSYGGFGVGLFITRTIVEAMGGRAHVESAGLGTGSTFIVDLPRAPPRGASS